MYRRLKVVGRGKVTKLSRFDQKARRDLKWDQCDSNKLCPFRSDFSHGVQLLNRLHRVDLHTYSLALLLPIPSIHTHDLVSS